MKRFFYMNLIVSLQSAFSLPSQCYCEETVRVHNLVNEDLDLWMWPERSSRWLSHKPRISQSSTEDISFPNLGCYYFMTKDDANRESHFGSFCLEKLFKGTTEKAIFLGTQIITTTRDEQVQVPYTESVVQTYTVRVPVTVTRTVIRNGVPVEEKYTVYRTETRTKDVYATKYRTETRTRERTEELPALYVRRNGELQVIPGKFGKRTIGVGFEIVEDGMKIVSVKEGSPATNCRGGEGKVYAIESGDVILSINGEKPTDTNRVLELIGDSRSDVEISVRDKDGKADRMLIVTPR
jgi:hypothetical protein